MTDIITWTCHVDSVRKRLDIDDDDTQAEEFRTPVP